MKRIVAATRAQSLRRDSRRAAALLLVLALGGCAWLETKQRELALRPTPTRPVDSAALRPSDVRFVVPVASAQGEPQKLSLWWLPHPDPKAPTLLYLHGTFRSLYQNVPKMEALREAGFSILAVDYRGWGDSTPLIPSESTINADVQVAWAELVRRQPDPNRRVIFGHSMGGAAAVSLASELHHGTDYGALVLESTFTRMPDVAAEAGFLGRIAASFTTLEFDSQAKIGRVDAPVLMLHGKADQTVPVQLGKRLRDAAPPGVRWVEIPGGTHSRLHSEAPEVYRQALRDLITEMTPSFAAPAPATVATP